MATIKAKLPISKVISNTPVQAPKLHEYKFRLEGDYDWTYIITTGDTQSEAQQNAIDEYYRQYAIAPTLVSLVSQIN